MEVTPKSSILNILKRFSVINHPFWGTSIWGNPHISPSGWKGSFYATSTTKSCQHPSGNELCNAKHKASCHCHWPDKATTKLPQWWNQHALIQPSEMGGLTYYGEDATNNNYGDWSVGGFNGFNTIWMNEESLSWMQNNSSQLGGVAQSPRVRWRRNEICAKKNPDILVIALYIHFHVPFTCQYIYILKST
jgi:hypothetical protein